LTVLASTFERISTAREVATKKACVLVSIGQLEVPEVARPEVSSRDVVVRVAAVGICGTDAHIVSGHANYNMDERRGSPLLAVEPQILGHEIDAYVAEKGRDVRDLQVGDHVSFIRIEL
jgi:L-iditol 2-dehydrogenase